MKDSDQRGVGLHGSRVRSGKINVMWVLDTRQCEVNIMRQDRVYEK